ncbi:hypothetical protein HD806DRAFT_507949 [Xylariaceae sp. AK1471]|nr:hypothetical protein HD806DRAFT_507949 [Xylariaceae sp. AK1471]
MTTRAMKLLAAVSTLLAGAALAQFPNFTNDIPVDAFYEIGSDFKLTWSETGYPGTFKLSTLAWNNTPYGTQPGPFGSTVPAFDSREAVLDEAVPYSAGSYVWKVTPAEGDEAWQGSGFNYDFEASFELGGEGVRSFHIKDPETQ